MKQIELYGDGIGSVEYVNHMGDDLTIVNSARVSFGVHKDELEDKDKKLKPIKRALAFSQNIAISKIFEQEFKRVIDEYIANEKIEQDA